MENLMFNNFEQIKKELKFLVDGGENTEYTRGALEIVASFIHYGNDCCHADNAIELAYEIGLSDEVVKKLYN